MTTAEKLQTAGVVVATVAIAARFYEAARTERKRTQPVVIVNERRPLKIDLEAMTADNRSWRAIVWLANEGLGPAFNIRFGVAWKRIRVVYRHQAEDPDRGNRQRVLGAGQTLPAGENPVMPLLISSLAVHAAAARADLDLDRVYWCRYENTIGQTWETRNPAERSADLKIRRVRMPRMRERYESWRYRRLLTAAENRLQEAGNRPRAAATRH